MESALTSTLNRTVEAGLEEISGAAFDEIMRQHQRRVYRVIYLLVRDHDTADTLTQECFLRAYLKRNSFRGEGRIESWLLRIAVNLVRDHSKNRRASFWKRLVGLETEVSNGPSSPKFESRQPSPERILLAREELQTMCSVLSALSPQQRAIFSLRFAEEMSLAQIADVLDLKVGTVKAQLARATGKLREMKEKQWK